MATARKSSVTRISDTPAKIAINLDSLERENGPVEPFVVVLNGKAIKFNDPQEIPWQDLVDLNDPDTFAELCLAEDDRETFLKTPLPTWKMQKLMLGFRDHYGLGSMGNDDA